MLFQVIQSIKTMGSVAAPAGQGASRAVGSTGRSGLEHSPMRIAGPMIPIAHIAGSLLILHDFAMMPGPLSGQFAIVASSTLRCWATSAGGVCVSQLDNDT